MTKNLKLFFLYSGIFCGIFLTNFAQSEEAHPGLGLEARYSEAVLAYNRLQIDEAIKILNEVLKAKPDYTEAMELKALALQNQGLTSESFDEYQNLYQTKSEKNRGPYAFQLGLLSYRMKRFDLAHSYFEKAVQNHFNEPTAHLFLGLIAYNRNELREAAIHFNSVSSKGLPEMRVVANYYLGMMDLKNGITARGTRELARARELALSLPTSKMATDTLVGINKILEPFGKSQYFGNVSFLLAYDSNISQTPSETASQSIGSSNATSQIQLSGGLGYMSPALNRWQWIPSYQFSYNKDFNSATKTYEYFSNTGSVYLNYKALGETSYGAKLQGSFIFQNLPSDPTNTNGAYQLTKYGLTGELGPYVHTSLTSTLRLQAELNVRPQTFYTQKDLSGTDLGIRVSLIREASSRLLNPSVTVTIDDNWTNSSEWKYRSETASFVNSFHFDPKNTVIFGFDLTHYSYYASSSLRADTSINPHLNWIRNLSQKWAFLSQLSYTKNTSNVPDTYSYNRSTVGLGISRSL